MPWYFRRSRKFGPFRVTISKSGISGSVGVGGLRLTQSSRGTHFSASTGTGLSYRRRLDSAAPVPNRQAGQASEPFREIASDHVSNMVEHDAVVERINLCERRVTLLPWIGLTVAALAVLYLSSGGLLVGSVFLALGLGLRNYLGHKFAVEFDYQLDAESLQKYATLQSALSALSRCQRLWRMDAFGNTDDWKRHAGARQLVKRSKAHVDRGTARSFTANVDIWHIKAGKDTIYFLPDMVLVKQGNRFGSLSYSNLRVTHTSRRFNEESSVPSDSQIVGSTWRYVNKSGGPDRRFSNNYEIPIVIYGEVAFRSDAGLRAALMTSNSDAVEVLASALKALQYPAAPR